MFKEKHVVILKSSASQSGGLEKYALRIASEFVAQGARVSILGTGAAPARHSGISFYPVLTRRWPSFLRMEQFDQYVQTWLKKEQPDLVFGMDRNRVQTHLRAGNGVHIAYLKSRVWTEGKIKHWVCLLNPMHRKILQLEKVAFEHSQLKKLFANSQMVRRELLEHYAIDPKKIEVIHNGVEWSEMASDFVDWEKNKETHCAQWGLDASRFHFLFIGNGYLRKGLDRLLEGLAQLPTRDFTLSVVGKDNRMDRYAAKAAQLGLKGRVRFFGPQADIRPFYQLADVLVIPSFYDPFANVTVEALAMGLFVVSSKHNGGAEILNPDNGAIIDDLRDVDAMTQALQRAMQCGKTAVSARKARQSVAHLDFSKQLRRLIEACE